MASNKNSRLYTALLIVSIALVVLLIYISYQDKLHLSLPLYFFILIICDLAATAFLTSVLKSTAEYEGNVMKGKLKMTGSAVVFILILFVGYKYRPIPKDDPFDLTIILLDPGKTNRGFAGDTLQVTLGNDMRNSPVNSDGKAVFFNIDSRFLGQSVPLLAKAEGFSIAHQDDTLVMIPNTVLPVIRIPVFPSADSARFGGFVLARNQGKPPQPLPGLVLHFTDFDKTVRTDSTGAFSIFLKAKQGDLSPVTIFKQQKWVFSGQVTLSRNMQILADE
jgi:hypothetical protein